MCVSSLQSAIPLGVQIKPLNGVKIPLCDSDRDKNSRFVTDQHAFNQVRTVETFQPETPKRENQVDKDRECIELMDLPPDILVSILLFNISSSSISPLCHPSIFQHTLKFQFPCKKFQKFYVEAISIYLLDIGVGNVGEDKKNKWLFEGIGNYEKLTAHMMFSKQQIQKLSLDSIQNIVFNFDQANQLSLARGVGSNFYFDFDQANQLSLAKGVGSNFYQKICYNRKLSFSNREISTGELAWLFSYINNEIKKVIFTIDLSNNKITKLPEYLLTHFNLLRSLNLANNRLSELPDKIFSGIPYLRKIDLSNNELAKISDEIFKGLKNLSMLDLSYNYFDDNELSELFESLKSDLPSFTVHKNNQKGDKKQSNEIKSDQEKKSHFLNSCFLVLFQLRDYLHLSNEQIRNIDLDTLRIMLDDYKEYHKHWSKVLDLDLNKEGLSLNNQNLLEGQVYRLLNQVGNKEKITSLDISNNYIKKLAENLFCSYRKLEILDLSGNQIKKLSNELLYECNTLRYFNLSNNQLSDWPEQLSASLTSLKELNLSENKFAEIPESFKGLMSLSILNLSKNQLRDLNIDVILSLTALEHFDLSYNYFEMDQLNVLLTRIVLAFPKLKVCKHNQSPS